VFQILIGKILNPSSIPPTCPRCLCSYDCQRALVDESGVIPGRHHHHGFLRSHIAWRINNRPDGGRSSETQSHRVIINQSYRFILFKHPGKRLYLLNYTDNNHVKGRNYISFLYSIKTRTAGGYRISVNCLQRPLSAHHSISYCWHRSSAYFAVTWDERL
jgi:hypothetical protein